MDERSGVQALEEALARFVTPPILNTDPGANYTADAYALVLQAVRVRTSMDDRGTW